MDMLTHLHLWRIHTPRLFCFRPSLPLNRSTTLATSNASTQASPPNTRYAVQYLVQSCGLSSDEALKASRHIPGLKSPDNADAVICYLREIGLSESVIRKVVLRDSRILCSSVEKSLRPNITKLQEVGLSNEDISGIISVSSAPLRFNFVSKIDFWMRVLESLENLSVVLKVWRGALVSSSLENVIMPNISFLLEHCGLSTRQIVRLIKSSPKLLSSKPEFGKRVVERAEELGIARSSVYFIEALIAVSNVSERTIDARLNNLRNIGFSQEEVALLISRFPSLLTKSEKLVARKMEFLMKEAGCDKLHVIRNPFLFCCNLENRLIPRNTVRKLLMSKGLSVANLKFATFAKLSDEKFVEKFVLPYEPAIPGLHRAFADAGTIEEKSVARKMEFLMKEAGCDKLHVIRNPFFLGCILDNRLIPRNIVRKLLVSKGLPMANLKFATFARPSDEKFVLPYEHVIPGFHRAYADAGRIAGIDHVEEHLKLTFLQS